jgi:hypothetical protein
LAPPFHRNVLASSFKQEAAHSCDTPVPIFQSTQCHIAACLNPLLSGCNIYVYVTWLSYMVLKIDQEFHIQFWCISHMNKCWYDVIPLCRQPALFCYKTLEFLIFRPPLWSSGQTSLLLTQRSRVWFPALPDFLSSSGSGTGPTQPLWG